MKQQETPPQEKIILAIVGMPGAGKSEAVAHVRQKGIPFVRFGDLTEEVAREMGLPLNPDNERTIREKLRKDLGMGAYAIKAEPKIAALLKTENIIAIDGLYSWEEYTYLKERFPTLILMHIYAEPSLRYTRLAQRPVRPVPMEVSRKRDITELENLNKGGPIALADHLIENNGDISQLQQQIDILLTRLGVTA